MTPFRVAIGLLVVCLVAAWQVSVIPESAIQMAVGPVLVPGLLVAALALSAVLYAVSAARGRQPDESHEEDQTPLPGARTRFAYLVGGGAVFMALVAPLGFVVPATLCGMGVARAFDAPLGGKSLLICGLIAAVFWWLFARLLGIGLGPALPFWI